MSHAELVKRAVRWLRGSQRCIVAVGEFSCMTGEVPDAIGWKPSGASILVECKTSLSDFYADSQKAWRRHPGIGVGATRYYLTPRDLLGPANRIPDGWGLLEVRGKVIRKLRPATPYVYGPHDTGPRKELRILAKVAERALSQGDA